VVHLYITDISPERSPGGASWDVDNLIISFRFFNTAIDDVKELTRQVQDSTSMIYNGQVSVF